MVRVGFVVIKPPGRCLPAAFARSIVIAAIVLTPMAAHAQADKRAEAVYKNIQVLNGVPASTFMNTMFFQRYALGVTCNYCHAEGGFEKDDKPANAAYSWRWTPN